MTDNFKEQNKHVIAILIENEFGALARVVNLFASRGYNIESLSVAVVDEVKNLSRITITTYGSQDVVNLILKLLNRLIPVHSAIDLSAIPHIERGLALIKVATGENNDEIMRIAEIHQARLIEKEASYFLFELSDQFDRIENFIKLLEPYDIIEISQTGSASLGLGENNKLIDWLDASNG